MKTVIILGSSRNDGNTFRISNLIVNKTKWDLINLNDYNFTYFDYDYNNRNDDFKNLIEHIISNYETLIFATPVYWYSMSGILKVFIDRFTDLLTIEKKLGQQLRSKKMGVISSSNGNNLGENFWLPFKEIAKYLGITYLGNIHTLNNEDNNELINNFIDTIKNESYISN